MTDLNAPGTRPFLQLIDHFRANGLACPTDRVCLFADALAATRASSRADIANVARPTLCLSPGELELLDNVMSDLDANGEPSDSSSQHYVAALQDLGAASDSAERWTEESAASLAEVRHKPIPSLNKAELARVQQLIEQLVKKPKTRRMFTTDTHHNERADLHRIARSIVRCEGDFPAIPLKGRPQRPVDLHIAIDVSGSMKTYAPTLLAFAILLQRNSLGRVAVYTIGTQCIPLDVRFQRGGITAALGAALGESTNYQGGTNLGASLGALAIHAQRTASSRRQLLIFSDGWDAGDPGVLSRAMARLRGLHRTIVWANPHSAVPGFQPVQKGMATALPLINHLVSGHSLAALEQVFALLTDSATTLGPRAVFDIRSERPFSPRFAGGFASTGTQDMWTMPFVHRLQRLGTQSADDIVVESGR
ncbi:VWA domain-containing protein [Arthrobacter ramosus]|uniref:VWA domain-containing protein n=2 Tax=Arthrobacter ramosus TaxID=1672 RepID=A0ABV5Y7T7_ARTRM|nr:VWA domain-containing protein [Arthrobacter ramosus]